MKNLASLIIASMAILSLAAKATPLANEEHVQKNLALYESLPYSLRFSHPVVAQAYDQFITTNNIERALSLLGYSKTHWSSPSNVPLYEIAQDPAVFYLVSLGGKDPYKLIDDLEDTGIEFADPFLELITAMHYYVDLVNLESDRANYGKFKGISLRQNHPEIIKNRLINLMYSVSYGSNFESRRDDFVDSTHYERKVLLSELVDMVKRLNPEDQKIVSWAATFLNDYYEEFHFSETISGDIHLWIEYPLAKFTIAPRDIVNLSFDRNFTNR